MERTLHLFDDTYVFVNDKPTLVRDLRSGDIFRDQWGAIRCVAEVKKISEDGKAIAFETVSTPAFVLPATAEIKMRGEDARMIVKKVTDLQPDDVSLFLMAKRKIRHGNDHIEFLEGLFSKLDLIEVTDEQTGEHDHEMVLTYPDPVSMRNDIMKIAAYGITVTWSSTEPKLKLDLGRPACFASKLLSGVYHGPGAEEALCSLYGGGVMKLVQPWEDTFSFIQQTGIVLEGENPDNLTFVLNATPVERRGRSVYEVKISGGLLEVGFVQI